MRAEDNVVLSRTGMTPSTGVTWKGVWNWRPKTVEITLVPFGQVFREKDGFRAFMGLAVAHTDIWRVENGKLTEDRVEMDLNRTGAAARHHPGGIPGKVAR